MRADRRRRHPRAQPQLARQRQADQRAVVSRASAASGAARRCLATSSSPTRRWRANAPTRASRFPASSRPSRGAWFSAPDRLRSRDRFRSRAMEALESAILARLTSPDPYLARDATGQRLTAMPDSDPTQSQRRRRFEPRNLPVPVPRSRARERRAAGWRARCARCSAGSRLDPRRPQGRARGHDARRIRLLAGRKPDAQEHPRPARAPRRRRRWCPRADIIAVQQDITLGELVRVFESAGHSRLVVYNDTLDDPVGMVHIRDLIAFMTARAAVDPAEERQAQEAVAGRPRPQGHRSRACRCRRPRSCAKSCSCRPRCGRSICWRACRRRASIWRW